MANCKICVKFDDCPWRSDPDAMCSAFRQRPMTNADRIRAMTNVELADFMICNPNCPPIRSNFDSCRKTTCKSCWLDWLKEEADD